ncbi:MAG: FtsW/RodA/SpoVE family cell cycle protein, partial [Candidatus Staskawiczbacteria bacterium]|nr:FtsW/RodA/SpoVE family cell cycle protein [Candidatus Staskawiczbacteria bacterium]
MGVFTNQLKKLDWGLIIPAILLVCFGLVSLYSVAIAKTDFGNFQKQIIFFGVGLLLMVIVSFFDYRIFKNNPYLILIFYGACVLLLAGLYFFAPLTRGTRGWYKVGMLSLDPIEPAKIVLIILLAKYFSMRHVEMYKFRNIIFSGL